MGSSGGGGGGGSGGVPPGFRFHPTDEELLHYYLKKKISFQKFDMEVIREVDLNKIEPWDLQEKCRIGSAAQNEWYFFSHKDRKYPTGSRTNRATSAGFWKATGRDKCIRNCYKKIGMRKTLVFYRGRAPHGQKTDWIMHEYRLEDDGDQDDPNQSYNNNSEDGWVVCRVFKKKNLFKVGNEGGSTSSFNSDHHHHHHHHNHNQLNSSSSTAITSTPAVARTFMQQRSSENQYQLRLPQNYDTPATQSTSTFEFNKSDLALHYSHTNNNLHGHTAPPHYSTLSHHLYHNSQMPPNMSSLVHKSPTLVGYDYHALSSLPPDAPLMTIKQLMTTTNTSRSDNGDHQSLRYQSSMEVGTNGQQQHVAAGGMNESWAVLDRLVTSHLGSNEDSSKEVRFEDDQNGSSVSQINHLSLRGEMDLWGYGSK